MKPTIYLVGGAVRDHVLRVASKDKDYVVVGATAEWMLEQGFQKVGADFPVFLHPETGYEYALARQERKTGTGYLGFETRFDPSITLEDDLIRRDLTINAMAMSEEGAIIDPYGGLRDLKERVLRHTSDAFEEDPLRVLRLARFAARYDDFSIAPETRDLASLIVKGGEMTSLPKERIWTEMWKGFGEIHPYRMIEVLSDFGALDVLPMKDYFQWFDKEGLARLFESVQSGSPLISAVLSVRFNPDKAIQLCIPFEVKRTSSHADELSTLITMVKLNPYRALQMIKKLRYLNEMQSPEMAAATIVAMARARTAGLEEDFLDNLSTFNQGSHALRQLDYQAIVNDGPKESIRTRVEEAEIEALKKLWQTGIA